MDGYQAVPPERVDGSARPDRDGARSIPVDRTAVLVTVRRAGEVTAVDVLLGLGGGAATLAWRASAPLRWASGIALAAASAAVPSSVTVALADRGRRVRGTLDQLAQSVLLLVVPQVVRYVLATLDVAGLVRDYVDLDRIIAGLDVAAVVDRLDLDALIARVDLEAVLRRVDLNALVGRVDLDGVLSQVDLDAVVGRLDLDGVVARVDLDAVVGRLDLDAIAARIDLDRLIERVDVQAVLAGIDLAGIAEEVIAAVDLPEIIRQSSGAVSSEAVRGVRSGGMQADDAVARFVDRLLRRGAGPAGSIEP
jgi:hypothetical protein